MHRCPVDPFDYYQDWLVMSKTKTLTPQVIQLITNKVKQLGFLEANFQTMIY